MQKISFKKITARIASLLLMVVFIACNNNKVSPPEPFGIVPSTRQQQWHQMEFYAFVHFTINTFTDREWGFGDESPKLFDPSNFDAEQIVLACKNAGMKGIVLTTKHHDGFCLWPTATTDHNISKSSFKDGKGDVVREIVDACRKHDMKVGMYLSPWDRNNAAYGTPEYIDIFRAQLTELLTNYGEIFEVWFDGANGGTGYYGGANEKREIDRQTYYDWENTWALVRELQPNAVIFSDVGPDVRWVGTEEGYSGDPCWHRFTPKGLEEGVPPAPGQIKYWESLNGTREGDYWMPAETNTSIRPGWFYHESENDKVKSPETLVDMYYESIGHGTNFILNIPPNKSGVVPEEDIKSLTGFKEILENTFKVSLENEAKVTASNERGKEYRASHVLDENTDTYWATEEGVKTASLILEFPKEVSFNVVNIQEYIPLGQRIWGWSLDSWENGEWNEFARAEPIGNRRLWRGPLQTTTKLRLRITKAGASPLISKISVHKEPVRLIPPQITRTTDGNLNILGNGAIHYTLDGSEPNKRSNLYKGPIDLSLGGMVKAKTYDGEKASETASMDFGYTKSNWIVLNASKSLSQKVIDEDRTTYWKSKEEDENSVIIDFGDELTVSALTMSPPTKAAKDGLVLRYRYLGSTDNKNWDLLAEGEFSNIYNNPIQQIIDIEGSPSIRYLKFVAVETVGNEEMVIAEIGVKHGNE
ncbi:alpha-L-fucosidase [Maribacter sp. LLG6340-A2]|uniref:alpha-L-fucosidase n=1 Tax=Maribacter sp. LLG6340-A2 TaxID=3160834 RepID=UPI00386F59A3